MQWIQYLHSMILESPCYDYPIARLVYLMCIPEPDQIIGLVIFCVLDGVVQMPDFQA